MTENGVHHKIVRSVLRWYDRNGRRLPWRGIRNPYRILVAEIMLQQTQTGRVTEKYRPFLKKFPTLRSLAEAPLRNVIVAWGGMGYNNRAVRLHALARELMNHQGGKLPAHEDELRSLPGIGPYTAAALMVAVHGTPVPVVDINVRRFLSRVCWPMHHLNDVQSEAVIWQKAGELLPKQRVYDWTQALMDMGATVCTARNPDCTSCPVSGLCASKEGMLRVLRPSSKREQGRGGIPNRIFRGRVVDLLRERAGRKCLPIGEIGNRIYPGFSTRDASWLEGLLHDLQKDGLVKIRASRIPPCVSLG